MHKEVRLWKNIYMVNSESTERQDQGEHIQMYVIKKDGTKENFNVQKVITAVNKSAARIMYHFTEEEVAFICRFAQERAQSLQKEDITIEEMHNIVRGRWNQSIRQLPRATAITATTKWISFT